MNLPFVASWKRFGDSVFIYSNCDSTFHGSAKSCAEFYGATLASVHSVEEMQVIFNLTQDHNDPAWLGGYKPGKKWRWLDSTPWDFEFWIQHEPNDYTGRERCLQTGHVK